MNNVQMIFELLTANEKLKDAYKESVGEVIALIENRYRRMEIKDSPVVIHDATTDWNIRLFMEKLRYKDRWLSYW